MFNQDKLIKITIWLIRIGIFIILCLPLFLSSKYFFPFIAPKNIIFRIIVEALFILYLFLAFYRKEFRPKFNKLIIAVALYFFVILLSTIFSVNVNRSLWSNFERMEGLIGQIHLFLYFIVLVNIFKKEKDWNAFFLFPFLSVY